MPGKLRSSTISLTAFARGSIELQMFWLGLSSPEKAALSITCGHHLGWSGFHVEKKRQSTEAGRHVRKVSESVDTLMPPLVCMRSHTLNKGTTVLLLTLKLKDRFIIGL